MWRDRSLRRRVLVIGSKLAVAMSILVMSAVAVRLIRESDLTWPPVSGVDLLQSQGPSSILGEAEGGFPMAKSIVEAMKAWEERLMAIPGVMGIGIGLGEDAQVKVIKVYVHRNAWARTEQIPEQIDGYPVEVELRGTFRAW